MNNIVTSIHHIQGNQIHQNNNIIISNINHCRNHVVAHQSVLQIIIYILLLGETKYSFINQNSLSRIISIQDPIDHIIVLIAIIPAAKNHM